MSQLLELQAFDTTAALRSFFIDILRDLSASKQTQFVLSYTFIYLVCKSA